MNESTGRLGNDSFEKGQQSDSGNVTVLTACLIFAITTLLVWSLSMVSLVAEVHRARGAADLAALAAAQNLGDSAHDVCRVAQTVAQINGAVLESCIVQGSAIQVTVIRETNNRSIHIFMPTVKATARAGYLL
ncbi:MAG: Rv3654c family TadE-like protein [Actinomycetes bacterium]